MKLFVFSICKDESATVGKLLDRIPKSIDGVDEIVKVVVDDGSTDDTVKVAKKHAALTIGSRQQKRLAFRFAEALDYVLSNGADIAVNIDGDLQFQPEDIPKLVKPIVDGQADFVAADRFRDPKTDKRKRPKNMPIGKYYANRLGSKIVGSLAGQKFQDVTCGFRAYNKKAMMAININSEYTYTQESFQILAMKRMDIVSIPIKVTYYPGRKSRVVTSFMQFLVGSAINILRAFRDFAPLKFFFWLGLPPFIVGLSGSLFVGIHWLKTDQTSPYTSIGIMGAYLFTLGLVIWILGLVADMLNRTTKNQEKIIELTKEVKYSKNSKSTPHKKQ